jgi:ParB-like chromosome segregation protein Spo0J
MISAIKDEEFFMEMTALNERDRKIAELAAQGFLNQRDIARRVGLHYNTVSNILKKPEVQAYVAQLKAEAAEPLPDIQDAHEGANQAAMDAIKALWRLVRTSRNETVVLKAAIELLDRAGPDIAPNRQLHGVGTLSHLTVKYTSVELLRRLDKECRASEQARGVYLKPFAAPENAVYLVTFSDKETGDKVGERFVDATGSYL